MHSHPASGELGEFEPTAELRSRVRDDLAGFMADLRRRDIEISAEGDRLRCNAPVGVLTHELRDELKRRKSDILEFLRSAQALARQQRAIVPLQPLGTEIPVFAVAGHNGDIFCYRALVQHLGKDQPFFGLQAPGVDGQSAPIERVDELAAYFARQIRTFRPNGPYIIGGFCAGGTIAFELACQLLRDGAAVDLLALFGSPYPSMLRVLPLLRQAAVHHMRRVRNHTRALASRTWQERVLYIAQSLNQRKARQDANERRRLDPALIPHTQVGRTTVAAVRRYTPGFFPGRMALFLPSRGWARDKDKVQLWRSAAKTTEEYFGPDGCDGDVMLLEPYAPAFAKLFLQCRQAQERTVSDQSP